jgi:hypothetical protein
MDSEILALNTTDEDFSSVFGLSSDKPIPGASVPGFQNLGLKLDIFFLNIYT